MSTHSRVEPYESPVADHDPGSGCGVPERLLLDQIADGALDPHLSALAQAIHARQHLLHTVRSVTALAMLQVGDRVRMNQHVRPRYLQGTPATVTEIDGATATVELDHPVGRFSGGQVRCPPLALDRLGPAIVTDAR